MIRHARMQGRPTLFLPGLDHASIAAQFVLDRIIAKDGESRASLGRERYLERMHAFVAETREVMLGQQRRRRRVVRLGPPPLHDGRRVGEGRPRGVHPALPRRPRVPRRGPDQLVPGLPDERERPRGDPARRDGHAVVGPLPPDRRGDGRAGPGRDDHRRHDAARDDPRRHRGRGPPGRRSLSGARRAARPDPVRRARRAGHRRPDRRARLRHGRREDHAGPRQGRLRDRPPPRPADAVDPRRRGRDREHRHALRRHGPLRGPHGDPRRPRRARRPRRGAAARDGHRPLRAEQRRHRAAPEDPVVHPDRPPRRGGPRGHPESPDPDPARAVREDLGALADEHPGLERLPPALVGPPDPGLAVPRRPLDGVGRSGRSRGVRDVRPAGRRAHPGPRHLRHLVQLRAVAVLDARLAGRHARLPPLLPDVGDGDRLRHPVLLGRPDGHARDPPDGRRSRSTRSTCRG